MVGCVSRIVSSTVSRLSEDEVSIPHGLTPHTHQVTQVTSLLHNFPPSRPQPFHHLLWKDFPLEAFNAPWVEVIGNNLKQLISTYVSVLLYRYGSSRIYNFREKALPSFSQGMFIISLQLIMMNKSDGEGKQFQRNW